MPVDMPDYAFAQLKLDPDLGIASARSEGGLIVTSRRGDPFWRGRMTTVPLEGDDGNNQHADMRAFLSRCVDLNLSVDFIHPRHRVPSAYTLATWPMAGDGAVVSVTDLRHIVVSGLDEDLVLRRGDRLSIVQGSVVVHRWIGAGVIVTSDTSQTVELTPRLPIGLVEAAATVLLKDPIMRLRVVPDSWDATEVPDQAPISFDVDEALV
jgi:hypothetical protein